MKKHSYFESQWLKRWPEPEEIKRLFFPAGGTAWFSSGGNDTASFTIEGVERTEHLEQGNGRIDVKLEMVGHPKYGLFLYYKRTQGPHYASKGDLSKLKTFVRTLHDDLRTLAFFIPFDKAWPAVREFILSDGLLPATIAWVDLKDVQGTPFPDPNHRAASDEFIFER